MPLKVKYLLTVRHQLAAILILSGIGTSILVFVMSPLKMFHVCNPTTNTTIAYFRGARWSIYIVFNNITFFGGILICIACVIILSASLQKASRFRDISTTDTSNTTNNGKPSDTNAKSRERQRNVRVVRTVIIVCIIFIVSNALNAVFFLLKVFVGGFGPGGKYQFTNWSTLILNATFVLISTCLNTIIYIFYNYRFRNIFLKLFGKKSDVTKVLS